MRRALKVAVWTSTVLAASLGIYYIAARPGAEPGRRVEARDAAPARRDRIVALGRLEPRGKVINVSAPPEDRVGRLAVEEGDELRAGATLAYLESYEERLARRHYV